MSLETRDPDRGRWRFYASAEARAADARLHPFDQIPRRIFLDTNVVNLLVGHADTIFQAAPLRSDLPSRRADEVEALTHVFQVGARAGWQILASAKMLEEVGSTPHPGRRELLLDYAVHLVNPAHAEVGQAEAIANSSYLAVLPDAADRRLLADAMVLGCDVFCTCDRRTIVNRRHQLPPLPTAILLPEEWWARVRPWGGLWL